jgi:hypothetical protein
VNAEAPNAIISSLPTFSHPGVDKSSVESGYLFLCSRVKHAKIRDGYPPKIKHFSALKNRAESISIFLLDNVFFQEFFPYDLCPGAAGTDYPH